MARVFAGTPPRGIYSACVVRPSVDGQKILELELYGMHYDEPSARVAFSQGRAAHIAAGHTVKLFGLAGEELEAAGPHKAVAAEVAPAAPRKVARKR